MHSWHRYSITWRIPGDTASEKSFKDVKQGAWYYNAVIWAADNGIVKGYEDGCFYPNRPITREQMVTMLYRYMQFKGLKVDASSEDWKSFTDYANVHAWAPGRHGMGRS